MKKTVVSSNRISRESKANPHQNICFKAKVQKSNCINYTKGSEIIDYGNGYSKIKAKKSQITIEAPIPLALSRLKIALKKAKEKKIAVIKTPISNIIIPFKWGAVLSSGIPDPIQKEMINDSAKLINKLIQIIIMLF